jgi:hypothetical protein
MNKDEDYFPESVPRFLDEIASGRARITTQESSGAVVAINEMRSFTTRPQFEAKRLVGYPKNLAGDPPGTAPVYTHITPDATRSYRRPDGSGEDWSWVEYWLFYGQDVCHLTVGTSVSLLLGGHRSDWEHTCFGVVVTYGANGVFQGSEVREGLFGAHGSYHRCDVSELELTDDRGVAKPAGPHPTVYISQGKHASYPEPGDCPHLFGVAHVMAMDEYFRGNGVTWRSWTSGVHDLEDRSDPELRSTVFPTLLAPGVGPFTDWTDYKGEWGPDKKFLFLAGSPVGPKATKWYGHGDQFSTLWKDAKTKSPQMVLGRWPQIVPTPVPTRK